MDSVSVSNGSTAGLFGIDADEACSIINTVISHNKNDGLWAGHRSTVFGCTVANNGDDGIIIEFGGSTVAFCSSTQNGDDGIQITDSSTPYGIIRDSVFYNNTDDGIRARKGCFLEGNVVNVNDDGIIIYGASLVLDNMANNNAKSGIVAISPAQFSRIQGNLVISNNTIQSATPAGIRAANCPNVIVKNVLINNNVKNYSLGACLVSDRRARPVTGESITSAETWADFSY